MKQKSIVILIVSIIAGPMLLLMGVAGVAMVFFPERWAEAEANYREEQEIAAKARAADERTERIEKAFSGWDGAHYELKKYVKKRMHDPDSFKCYAATWRDLGNVIEVTMAYDGNNAYGQSVREVITAHCLISGEVVQIVE